MVFDSNRNNKNENNNISYYKVSIITENRNQVFSRVWYSTRTFKWHFCISFRSCQLKCWRNYLLVFGLSNLFGGYIASVNYVAARFETGTHNERIKSDENVPDNRTTSLAHFLLQYHNTDRFFCHIKGDKWDGESRHLEQSETEGRASCRCRRKVEWGNGTEKYRTHYCKHNQAVAFF